MFEGLDQAQLPGAIEAMLFVTDEPVGVIELADMLEADPKLVEQALVDLREKLEREQRGIQLREVAGGWRLYTHPAYHSLVEKYVLSWDTRKGLIREAGQADAPGNPTLYATTRGFLEKFGLRSVRDLPNLDEFAPDDATRQLIRERLSAGGQEAHVAPEAQVSNGEADDPFDGLQFDFDDEGASAALTSQQGAGDGPASSAAQQMLADAMAQSFGLVEKIDFDSLKFETDDE